MELIHQVCGLDQAKKIVELGIDTDTYFYFKINEIQTVITHTGMADMIQKYLPGCNDYVPAYSSAELGVMLPPGFKCTRLEGQWDCEYENYSCDEMPSEAVAKAGLLIALLRDGLVTTKNVNYRLRK